MVDYLQEEKNHLQTLKMRLDETENVSIDALARPDIPHGFAECLPIFAMVKNQILDVKALNLSSVPYGQIETAASAIQEANRLYNTVQKIIAPSTPDRTHQTIMTFVNHWRGNLAPALSNLQRYAWSESSTRHLASNLSELEARLKSSLHDATHATAEAMEEKSRISSEYESFSENATKRIDSLAVTGKELTDKLTATLAGLGAAEYMKRFEAEANHHNTASWCWLAATAVFAIMILCAGLHFISVENQTIEAAVKHGLPVAIATASTRLLVMSILSVGLFVSLRNYSACRHNFIVNKHRINALGTFELFRSAADDETKKAVLLQSMKAVFDPQNTGYLKTAGETQHGTQIIELMQSGLTKSGGTHN